MFKRSKIKYNGIEMEVEFDYTAPGGCACENGQPMDDNPSEVEIIAVYVNDLDITPIIGADHIQEISDSINLEMRG